MKERVIASASMLSAFLASLCWIGLAILIPLGLSGLAGTLAVTFAPYRIWFIIITVIMLSIAHLLVWKQKNRSKKTKNLLWISTVVSGVMVVYTIFSQGI